ncbi:copper chaperone CopZ [Radiobacillus kanasensis]|uniref:copper chaperone CopZ n=1 Tax=Radiobacillus kanasensis TaxID=2844358 RepID=UPI001E54379D|nr:copper chaperone CopZ [Radiobacillus kanasensis]UFT98260.1 copper chaperone CopZ [Radiobacillus kanasensis]
MSLTLQVTGMSCGHCEQAVKEAINSLNGIQSVKVNLSSGQVDVDYDENQVTPSKMKEAIEDQGYDVA